MSLHRDQRPATLLDHCCVSDEDEGFLQNTVRLQTHTECKHFQIIVSFTSRSVAEWTKLDAYMEKRSQALDHETLLRIKFPVGNKMNLEYPPFLFITSVWFLSMWS